MRRPRRCGSSRPTTPSAGTANRPALELAERVSGLAPMEGAAVFFASGGSDAVDTAGKLALRYWSAVVRPEKRIIVHRERSYHGMNAYGTSLAGIPGNLEGFGTLVPETEGVNENDTDALEQLFSDHGERIAAFIGEPVIGAGGIFHPTPATGIGCRSCAPPRRAADRRRGDLRVRAAGHLVRLPSVRHHARPGDLRQGLTSGYLPLGAVLASQRVQEPFCRHPGAAMFRHGYTYSGHPAVCAAGLANLDMIERESLVERVAQLESVLAGAVEPLRAQPLVSDIRAGIGLLAAIEIDADARAAEPWLIDRMVAACRSAAC